MGKLGIQPSEFWDMTFPELLALTSAMPKPGAGGLTAEQQADLYNELKEEGHFQDG